jgi:glycine/sarcosine N-methyltransferase
MYNNLANIYDELFPVSAEQRDFFIDLANRINPPKNLLDIGCATGELAIHLDNYYNYISAIDLNSEMIQIAKNKAHSAHLDFQTLNMVIISHVFFDHSFSVISCLGNTLSHLNYESDLNPFLNSCHKLLREKGTLVLQLINYEKIFKQNITALPTIENDKFIFERRYEIFKKNLLKFQTKIIQKSTHEEINSEIPLNCFDHKLLQKSLEKANFSNIQIYEDFSLNSFQESSDNLIITAET